MASYAFASSLNNSKKNLKQLITTPSRPNLLKIIMFGALFAGIITSIIIISLAASASLYISPSSGNQTFGSNFTVSIRENSGSDPINAVQADLAYDSSKLEIVGVNTSSSAFDLEGQTETSTAGIIKIARSKSSTSLTGDQLVATVTFKTLATGSTTISFSSSSAVVSSGSSTNILSATFAGSFNINDTSAPTVPTGLQVNSRTVNSVALSWAASNDNIGVSGYQVYRNGTLISSNVTATNFTDTGLLVNTNYSYRVSAFDSAGNVSAQSSSLNTSTLPDTTAPSIPVGLSAGTRTVNSINFSWTGSTDNVGIAGYNVYQNGTMIDTTTNTNYSISGLTPNTNYGFRVSAYDAAGNTSALSSTLNTSTLADTTAPSTPTNISSNNQTTNSINISWTASTDNVGVAGYNIFRNGTKVGTSVGSSYTDTGLTQGTSYNYTVSAYDTTGNTSSVSTSQSFTTTTKLGDANSDGSVNIFDLSILASNYGLSGRNLSQGDLNGDGIVNIFDLSILASNWGS